MFCLSNWILGWISSTIWWFFNNWAYVLFLKDVESIVLRKSSSPLVKKLTIFFVERKNDVLVKKSWECSKLLKMGEKGNVSGRGVFILIVFPWLVFLW